MSAPGVIGPSLDTRNDVALDIPSCVQIRTPKDEAEFREFIARIVMAARAAWENGSDKREPPSKP